MLSRWFRVSEREIRETDRERGRQVVRLKDKERKNGHLLIHIYVLHVDIEQMVSGLGIRQPNIDSLLKPTQKYAIKKQRSIFIYKKYWHKKCCYISLLVNVIRY